QDVTETNLESLRGAVGVVTQRTEIISGTVAENIALFAPLPSGAVEHAIAALGLTDWVAGLPDGLGTKLGAGGTKLSAGEEQLVSFARLLVRNVQVVVLDEATARMDPLSEARVVAASQKLLAGRTGVIVAHRLSTIERADLVAVLDHGRVAQFGYRTDLASQPGPFRDLLRAARSEHQVSDTDVDEVTEASPTEAEQALAGSVVAASVVPASSSGSSDVGSSDMGAGSSSSDIANKRRKGRVPDRRAPHQGMGQMRAVVRTFRAHKAWGLLGALCFGTAGLLASQGPIVGLLWGETVTGIEQGTPTGWLLTGLIAALFAGTALVMYGVLVYPMWWIQVSLRTRLNVMRGQTMQRRLPATPAGEVVARAMDSDRFLGYSDAWIDFCAAMLAILITSLLGWTWIAGAVLVGVMGSSALIAWAGRSISGKSAKAAADQRARYGRELVSTFDAVRTVKLSARTGPVHEHLAEIDAARVRASIREQTVNAVLGGVPVMVAFTGQIVAWFLFYLGMWPLTTTMMVAGTATGFIYYAWVAGAVITQAPGVRAWQVATQAFADGADLTELPVGVDLVKGLAPQPKPVVELVEPVVELVETTGIKPVETTGLTRPFERLELRGITTLFDDDGTIGVSDADLTVNRGELVLLLGRVGCGKSSLLAMLAGLMSYDGELLWNGEKISDPEEFLRPGRVAYVAQVPHVLSGTFADNISLDHKSRPLDTPVQDARLSEDVAVAGGMGGLVGHRGVKLSGGQVQRLALARALASESEILVADDVSSALDAATEIELWDALRARGMTVIGSTSKTAALARADRVVVVVAGEVVANGAWTDLAEQWGHLAG
ncbi:MAG: ATP-binding cassette domain-containing protein, partial [Promicromonosporaceae bacterium]|nr:ATP-binding cassette domain-containing protein [Promicromonosporaceae bacterium]